MCVPGRVVFSWRSCQARSAALFWLAMLVYSGAVFVTMAAQQTARATLWELAPRCSLYSLSSLLIFVPITMPHYAPAISAFTVSWQRMEVSSSEIKVALSSSKREIEAKTHAVSHIAL